ncbi:MAG TPA: hypothetical protein VGQ69_13320 [Gemmatimonadales bacterium]|nr:hypothetical protein [Gemmatimonadales bacterium]
MRYGRGHARELERLRRTQWLDHDALVALQQDSWNQIRQAAEATPLYQALWAGVRAPTELERLAELPVLCKDTLRAAGRGAVNSRMASQRLLEIHTGGTTGSPLTVFCTRQALRRNYAFFSRLQEWAGLGERPRTATFAGRPIVPITQQQPPYWRSNRPGNALLFSSYHLSPQTIPDYAKQLARYAPELIDSYPSSLEPIARWLLVNQGIAIRPRAVVTSSETLTTEVRGMIEAAFGCRVFDYYGAAEMAAFISQCEMGTYHPNPEFGVVEVLCEGRTARPGELGELVVTGFVNPTMPLIRFATGDLAVPGEGPCACGRAFSVLQSIEGRRDDVLVTPEGRLVGRLDPIFKKVESIYETRVVQDAPDHVRVEVVPVGVLPARDADGLRKELEIRLGPAMRIDIVPVESIPRTQRGKFRSVVNLVARSSS